VSKVISHASSQSDAAKRSYRISQLERRPAPGTGSGIPWPTAYYINTISSWCITRYALGWDRIDANPNAAYPSNRSVYNNYRLRIGATNSTRTAADGDYWVFGARLGPKNSVWFISGEFLLGPDFGNINVDFYGPVTEEEDGSLTPTVDDVEVAGDWIWAEMQPAFWGIGYATTERSDQFCDPLFIIRGDDGVLATTYDPPGGGGDDYAIDGGSGIYYFKMRVDDKNASSSGFKAAVADLWVVRGDQLNASSEGVYLG
jgi:hypothetical protein